MQVGIFLLFDIVSLVFLVCTRAWVVGRARAASAADSNVFQNYSYVYCLCSKLESLRPGITTKEY